MQNTRGKGEGGDLQLVSSMPGLCVKSEGDGSVFSIKGME